MEFVIVRFNPADRRNVIANGNIVGETDTELTLPADFYRITLSGEHYAPSFWEGIIAGTLPTHPKPIVFTHA
jgi:hypothetical protein